MLPAAVLVLIVHAADGGSAQILTHGSPDSGRVALTFDACPTASKDGYDKAVIDELRDAGVPATLFLSGRWAELHPEVVKELGADPLFELGNHTWIHPHMTQVTEARQRRELERTQEILTRLTGKTPWLFRPPFGEVNPALARVAASLGLVTVQFDLASGDPDKSFGKARLTRGVLKGAKPGSIVVMHMNKNGWHTAEALPAIVQGLRERGFVLSKVSELIQ